MEYITTKEASAKWGISTVRITILANEGRIPGAQLIGRRWLIPANATKPIELKPQHSGSPRENINHFSFPLYHFRPEWSSAKEAQLSEQQQSLLMAETALLECRFADAYSILEPILPAPDDIYTESGCLWNAGICCIALNKPEDFSRIYLRLQVLLSEDFSYRDDLVIILDILKTYIESIGSAANDTAFRIDIHDQCLPMMYLQIGYMNLSKEAIKSGTTDTTLLELGLRYLNTTSALIAKSMLHCHLLGIYYIRHDMNTAEMHAKEVISIAFENKYYFPLITYYRYFAPVLAPILAQYPKKFQKHCHELILQYEKNFTAFISSKNDYAFISKLTDTDYPYIYAVLSNLTNTVIAEKLGVSKQIVNRRLVGLYKKLGVNNKQELREYLLQNM